MQTLLQDAKYAFRLMGRHRGFSAAAIATLGLGIGASALAFSVIDAALLRPVPFPDPEQLVRIRIERPVDGRPYAGDPSLEDLRGWMRIDRVFSHLAAAHGAGAIVITDGPDPERTAAIFETHRVTEQQLPMLGVSPAAGRDFRADEMSISAPNVAMIGYDYWQRRYGGESDVIGRTIRYRQRGRSSDEVATIVGVLPSTYWRDAKLVLPLRESGQYQDVVGRLRPGVSIDDATRALTEAGRSAANRSAPPVGPITVTSLIDEASDGFNPDQVALLSGAAGLLLLLSCVNVAGLVLARGFTRQPELAVRASMGAGRFRLVRQLLTETAVLSIAGGIAGAIVASLVMRPLFDNVLGLVPENASATVNLSVLSLTATVALFSGVIVGLVPALRLSRVRLSAALSRGSRTQGTPLSRRGGQILIAAEVALTIVVVAGAALLVRSYLRMGAVDPGYDRGAIVTMDVTPLDQDDDATIKAFYPALLAAVRARPEVAAAGLCDCFKRNFGYRIAAAGGLDPVRLTSRGITPGVLEALNVTLRLGRLPTDLDLAVKPPPVVLSESAARRLFAERSPLGERVQVARVMGEVIGVVTDVNFQAPFETDRPEVFYVSADAHPVYTSVVLRPRADAPNLVTRLRETAQSLGTRAVVDTIRTGRERPHSHVQLAGQRTFLAGLLAVLSLALALVGVFGMTAFTVARRVREIGVRVALGATPRRIVRDTVRDSAVPTAIGIAVGLIGAALSTRVIASFLFNTSPTDAGTFAVVTLVLGAGACLAAWLPARRAARVDPVKALTAE